MPRETILIPMLCVSAACAQTQPFFAPGQDPKPAGKTWQKVESMSDEFDGPALDRAKWQSEPIGNGWVWDGRPPALFKASNVTIRDGKMAATVSKLDERA